MPRLPKILDRRKRDPGNLFTIEELDLEFSNGERRTYERLISRGLGAVIVVPVSDDGRILLVREYAVGLNHYEMGLVKGRLEHDETILEAAQRELREEAGFAAQTLTELSALSLAPGYMTHVTHVVLAEGLYEAPLEGDEPEPLEVIPWDIDDLWTLTARPDCTEGRTIAALYLARDYLRNRESP